MKTLNHAIGLGMVGRSSGSFRSKECHESIPQVRFKLTTTIGDNRGWHTKTRDPTSEEGLGHSGCSDSSERYGFRPSCEAVNTGKQVGKSSGWWKWSNKVNVNNIKTGVGLWKGREWSSRVSLNLGSLALYARTSPATNISIDARPYETGRDEFLGCSYSGM